jgi:ribosome-associated translation inhibitor RaiA
MKMKKKLFAILLSIVMVVGLLPTVAFAAENYDLYVNGEQFTSEKLSITCGEGTASYDPNTKTLTLNNATITNGGKSDESPKYGIRVVGDTDLTIKLSGTNSITLDNGGGIFADGSSDNYNIIGDGKLTINVKWDALYTLNGNISISEGAKLDITSAQGCGITSYNKGILSIDGAKVAVSSYYTAASARELEIKNNSEVVLIASADQFNAVYMGDENGAGKIEIINSKVEATSYYPALFTEGDLTVNGGEVKCTSTADGAIWTRGDILIKGGAKVTTYSEYPMGGNGSFTVEEAEIDAKNTNENNIPAIFDESVPVIADGYHLNYAKAVDSEGTEIDLLSSGTQYFALYKNVHFITKAVYPVSFVVTPDGLTNVVVKVNGQEVTGTVSLEAGTYPVEVTADNCKAYTGNITITADAATHTQTIAMTYLPADYTKVDEAIAKANALNTDEYKDFTAVEAAVNAVVRDKNITEQSEVDAMAKAIEDAIAALQYKDADYTKVDAAIAKANALKKDDYKDFSGVEAAVNAVVRDKNITEQSEVDAMAKAIEDAIAALQYKDADYTKVDAAIAKANALKKDDYKDFSGVEAAVNAVVRDKNITEQSEVDAMAKAIEDAIAALEKKPASTKPGTSDKSPQTGDTSNVALWIALLFVSGGAAIGATVVSRKKKYNR